MNRCEEGLWGRYLAQVGPSNLAEVRDLLLPAKTGNTKDLTLKVEREQRGMDSLTKMKEFSWPKCLL